MIATILRCRRENSCVVTALLPKIQPLLEDSTCTTYDVHRRPINLVDCTYWLIPADMSQLVEWLNNHRHITWMGIIYFMIATKAAIQDVGLCVHWNPSWDRRG